MWGRKDDQTPSSAPAPSRPDPVPARPVAQPSAAAAAPVASAPSGGSRSQASIGKSLKIKGSITGTQDLYIDGEVKGTIQLEANSLTIGPNGIVDAEITAKDIIIEGKVTGNVKAGDRVDIRKTGSLHGDLSTARIVIQDGAVFRGSIDIVKPAAPAPKPAAAPAPTPAKAPVAATTATASSGAAQSPAKK
jgi:cytoskeletal protein CcmA (bactofilin family)